MWCFLYQLINSYGLVCQIFPDLSRFSSFKFLLNWNTFFIEDAWFDYNCRIMFKFIIIEIQKLDINISYSSIILHYDRSVCLLVHLQPFSFLVNNLIFGSLCKISRSPGSNVPKLVQINYPRTSWPTFLKLGSHIHPG